MSVISGMDEVIAYIKKQDEKIKNLETNEKVREELIVELQEEAQSIQKAGIHLAMDNTKLKKEIESQKSLCNHMENLNKKNYEENSKLKNGIIDEHARAERCKDKVLDLANISKGLQKDVKKLKKEKEEMINVNNKFKELLHKETSLDDMFIDELMDKANGE